MKYFRLFSVIVAVTALALVVFAQTMSAQGTHETSKTFQSSR